jgi:hypothetical protein
MTREWPGVRAAYRKLLKLYPRTFRAQLGESMVHTFGVPYHERA